MHDLHLLADFVVILGVALVVAWAFSKLKLPTIVGFLAAGVLLGPGTTGLISGADDIALLAEIGVVLLLFDIGLELSLSEMKRMARLVFGAGLLQVTLTAAAGGGAAWALGFPPYQALFFGLLGALSSTAIVLTSLKESDELSAVHGRGMLGVLIFQDLAIVPLILVVPLLAAAAGVEPPAMADAAHGAHGAHGAAGEASLWWTLGKAGLVIGGVWLVATYVFPWIAERIARSRRRELFTLFTVVVGVGTAYVSGAAGLSLALGAFLAGIVISESPFSDQMIAEVEPFKDVFNSLFFVSMGLMVDPMIVVENPGLVAGLVVGVLVLKALVTGTVVFAMGYGMRIGILVGLGLAQVGEFSFVLAKEGMGAGLMTETQYGLFLATAVATMVVTPFLLAGSARLAEVAGGKRAERFFEKLGIGVPGEPSEVEQAEADEEGHLSDHVIIVGFGTNGKRIARAMRSIGADYVIVELNPQTVREYESEEPIRYGDATREPILKHLGAHRARALILTAGDRRASERVVSVARRLSKKLRIVVRTRFEQDLKTLYRAGADQVIVEELETSLEMVGQAMEAYGISARYIVHEKDDLRRENYGLMRTDLLPDRPQARHTLEVLAAQSKVELVRVPREGTAAGRKIGDLHLRSETGATILGIVREQDLVEYPDAETELQEWDLVLLVGEPDAIMAARRVLVGEAEGVSEP